MRSSSGTGGRVPGGWPPSSSPQGPSPVTSPRGVPVAGLFTIPLLDNARNGVTPQRAIPSLALRRDIHNDTVYIVDHNRQWILCLIDDARMYHGMGFRVYNTWDGHQVTEFVNPGRSPNPQDAFSRQTEAIDRILDEIENPKDEQPVTPTKRDHRSPPGSGSGGRNNRRGPGGGSGSPGAAAGTAA